MFRTVFILSILVYACVVVSDDSVHVERLSEAIVGDLPHQSSPDVEPTTANILEHIRIGEDCERANFSVKPDSTSRKITVPPAMWHRVYIDDTCDNLERHYTDSITEALMWAYLFLEQGLARVKEPGFQSLIVGSATFNQATLNERLKDFCAVWDHIFGFKGVTTQGLRDWEEAWLRMERLTEQLPSNHPMDIQNGVVRITCFQTIQSPLEPDEEDLCYDAHAWTFRPGIMVGIVEHNGEYLEYQTRPQDGSIINLCPDFFLDYDLHQVLQEFFKKYDAAEAEPDLDKKELLVPEPPSFEQIENTKPNWHGDESHDDQNTVAQIRELTETEGFTVLGTANDPNVLFGIWCWFGPNINTKGCDM